MTDHSELLHRVLAWDWPPDAEVRKTTDALILAADVLDAIPGDDKRLVAEWMVKIAAELMDEWEEGSTHADTYYIVEHWWRACPPSVRAALRGES